MSQRKMTLEEIKQTGLEALNRELGPVGMIRFLQQYEIGWGDYSSARFDWLGNQSVKSLATKIQKSKKSK
jgi:hypothetical protein